MKQELARGWVVLTLEYLEEKNQIKRTTGKDGIKFFPSSQVSIQADVMERDDSPGMVENPKKPLRDDSGQTG